MIDQNVREVLAAEEAFVRMLRSDVMRVVVASALRKAGVRDESEPLAGSGIHEADSPLPLALADAVLEYITRSLEAGIVVRCAALTLESSTGTVKEDV